VTALDVDLPGEPEEEIDTTVWLGEALERIRPALRHAVEVEQTGGRVQGVPGRLEQALVNLLHNADRYHRGGGPVRVRSTVGGTEWRLVVEDGGPGIPEENLHRIFDRYFTTAEEDGKGTRGRGLGLAVVKRIVEHHGGRVFADNRPEGGAAVGMVLPTL
jgi:two-component system sensor histidine kinase KdpD